MKEIFVRFQNKAVLALAPVAVTALTVTTAFASGSEPLPTIAITQDMLKPLVDGVISNIGVVLPIGLSLFAVFLGIKLVPRVIGWFIK